MLDHVAETANESRNALADRLLGQALRTERHPLIRFRRGAAGRCEPHLTGSRLKVRQIVASIRGHDGDIDQTASTLSLSPGTIRAAVAYYADFASEVDADAEWAERVEADERSHWELQQSAIA